MFGHLCVVLVEDEDEDEPVLPVDPVVLLASSVFDAVCTLVTFALAGVLAALATAAPPNPSPNAPEITVAAMSGFFNRISFSFCRPVFRATSRQVAATVHSTERSWSKAVEGSARR